MQPDLKTLLLDSSHSVDPRYHSQLAQDTSLHKLQTLQQVDMPDHYSLQLQRTRLCKLCSMIWLISARLLNLNPILKNSSRTQLLRDHSKSKCSTVSPKEITTKLLIISWTLSLNQADSQTYKKLLKLIFHIARSWTKKKTSKLSQLNNYLKKRKIK